VCVEARKAVGDKSKALIKADEVSGEGWGRTRRLSRRRVQAFIYGKFSSLSLGPRRVSRAVQKVLLTKVKVRDVYQNKRRVVRSGERGGDRSADAESGSTGSE
jgi:hypothetical protein